MAEFASLARPSDDRLRIAERCLSTAALDFFFFFFPPFRIHAITASELYCERSLAKGALLVALAFRVSRLEIRDVRRATKLAKSALGLNDERRFLVLFTTLRPA